MHLYRSPFPLTTRLFTFFNLTVMMRLLNSDTYYCAFSNNFHIFHIQNNDLYPLQRLYKETAFLQFSVAQGGYFYNRLMHFDPLLYWCFATLMKCKSFKNCILIPRLIVISGLFSSLHSTLYLSDVGANLINAQPFSFGRLLGRKCIYVAIML